MSERRKEKSMSNEVLSVQTRIANAILDGLKRKGMNKKQLADEIPISQQSITNWTNGQKIPTTDNINKINSILDIDLFAIIKEEGKRAKRNTMNKQTVEIKDLDTIEKAKVECERILTVAGADKYPHAIYKMLEWLVTASIGLTYHWYVHKKNKDDGTIYEDVFFYLNSIIEDKGLDACGDFFAMDMDIMESSVPLVSQEESDELIAKHFPNYDYASECCRLWGKFRQAYDFDDGSYFNKEFKVALLDVISENSCY